MPRVRAAFLLTALLLASAPAFAQDPPPAIAPIGEEPIAAYVVDARGAMARFKQMAAIGASLGVDANTNLPTRGFGLVVGAHLYPLRRGSFALGVGGELLLRTRASRTAPPATQNGPGGPTVTTKMSGWSPQVSFNFGKRNGYSYISGGIGRASLSSERETTTAVAAPDDAARQAINYGGGARWFARKHLAFSLDLRFYAVRPREASAAVTGYPRMTVMVFSAGVSMR